MATNIEIEAKVLIDEEGYKLVKNKYREYAKNSYLQTNYYIDTLDFRLRKNGIGLRIREIDDSYCITLKAPLSEGLLEKTENISKKDYLLMKKDNIFPEIKIKSFLIMLGFKIEDLSILASLKTERIDVHFDSGTFSIDKNTYANKIDYELEKESNNLKDAEDFLCMICKDSNIPFKINTVSKQARAFNEIKR